MNEYPGLVDSHFHLLSLKEKGLNPHECLAEFFAAGGRWALDVAVDAVGWDSRLAWGEAEPRLGFAAGIHPSEAPECLASDLDAVAKQVQHPRCWALGEIGLDWYRGRESEAAQRSLFRSQLALAQENAMPVVIHNREADREILEDLEGWSGTGILHCFSSDIAFARQVLDRGFFLSFAGNLTYKASESLREVARWAPVDCLLIETDAPYLPPQPFRGKPNRPVHAGITAKCLSEARGIPLEEVLQVTGDNFARLMRLTDRE